ncbi:proline dehydrogenase family protein [Pseudobdellovibrio exovorus]|uniref:L-glutamate gamma-semialdehyde dehydrogenase n=1 Tax=Pseudobdellovibrio exovorus JSS TaxID=1184267 RepID=M4VRQ9_9BACT|nr:proline dehydrogenase family protein [Pseudobdellovibrio exovorus]AGH95874.1 1-pyrroline-5 carboxylate dehydrogenase [Pseudobdellovibrio exovorus JSS]
MQDTQSKILSLGEEILKKIESQSKASLFSKDFWYGSIMEWSMKNDKFKTNMFRFVDVLPALNSGDDVAKHLKEYFSEGGKTELPAVFNVGLGLGSLAPGLMAGAIKKNVTSMAKMFITGENPQDALTVLKKARKNNLTFTVDILGEATLSEKEAMDYQRRYLELIEWLAKDAATWNEIPQLDRDADGSIPKVNVSVKMSALYSQINDKAWNETKTILKDRLRPVFKKGMDLGVFINLDMEHYGVKHLTVEVFKELINEPELRSYRFFGCVVQAYLRDSFQDIKDLTEFARERGVPFTIRLVKGAYWDSETIEAKQKDWPIPVYTIKAESDANYEVCASYLLENYKHIRVALASHNVRSLSAALVKAEQLGLPKNAFEIQMLYGMAEPIKKTFADMGYRVREYAPVGELIPGMAYLVRRLLENTSNESWLRGKFAEDKTPAELLKDPSVGLTPTSPLPVKKEGLFYNEALLDFAVAEVRQQTLAALDQLRRQLPVKVLPVVAGQALTTEKIYQRKNPSLISQTVAEVQMADNAMAEKAIQAAHKAYASWKKVSATERAAILDKAADLMLKKRYQLMATQVLEVGKPWAEADGDICEAIDFLRYYARHMRELAHPLRVGHAPGEISQYIYKPRGVVTVIAPWNFPLAILAGQVTAAIVTGNTVVMKPAEQSSLVAQGLFDILKEAGLPTSVVEFLPGYGEEVGDYLVKHPLTTTIAFTGSKAVGLMILKNAAEVKAGQQHVKRCIIEMGGKNALIIDNDADLDEAVDAVLYSAFGFSGQKCSAASRVIVLDEVYEKFTERLVEAARSIKIASSENPDAYLGPVVDEEAYTRLMNTIQQAEQKYTVLFKGESPVGGYYAPITILGNVQANDDVAQNEFFGPIMALVKARDLDHAIEIANSTEYALTGGLFSRSPANIEKVKKELEVGNMYINRGITGAMVERHPFGGFKMSGIGSKTGGPDYLRQFMEPIVVTENTMRRGFAPEE